MDFCLVRMDALRICVLIPSIIYKPNARIYTYLQIKENLFKTNGKKLNIYYV